MEQSLDEVEEGNANWVKIVDDFYVGFEPRLEKAEKEMREVEIKDEPAGEDCELCNHPMVFKMGKYGKFMACSNFPDCRNTKPIVKEIGVTCPKCDKGQIIERRSNKRNVFSMGAVRIQSVTLYLGISRLAVNVRSVKVC